MVLPRLPAVARSAARTLHQPAERDDPAPRRLQCRAFHAGPFAIGALRPAAPGYIGHTACQGLRLRAPTLLLAGPQPARRAADRYPVHRHASAAARYGASAFAGANAPSSLY